MTDGIPFEQIKSKEDRSWSLRLASWIAADCLDQIDDVIDTLICLDDHRVEVILTELMVDSQNSDGARKAASKILTSCTTLDTASERSSWWKSGDPILMRHALCVAERDEFVFAVAQDCEHPNYIDAIRALASWEEPEYQQKIIAALSHHDAQVRAVAAKSLIWEQPVTAEERLLEIASEDFHEVAMEALTTLCYCASKRLLEKLNELQRTGPQSIRDGYSNTLSWVAGEFSSQIFMHTWTSEAGRKYFDNWLESVKELIPVHEPDDENDAARVKPEPRKLEEPLLPDVEEIIRDLSDADGCWREKKSRYSSVDHWTSIDGPNRRRLSHFLLKHPDPCVRDIACAASVVWNDIDSVLKLTHDSVNWIRKSAVHKSKDLRPDARLAQRLSSMLEDPTVGGSHGSEVLDSYLIHSTPNGSQNAFLLEYALNDKRPSVRRAAVSALHCLSAKSEIEQLRCLLLLEPQNTWELHIDVISACTYMEIPLPCLDHLKLVDNLWLQVELADAIDEGQSI